MDFSEHYLTSRVEIGDFIGLISIYGIFFGTVIVGLGVMMRGFSNSLGVGISKLGGGFVLTSIIALFAHALATKYRIHAVPVWFLWILAVVVGLKVLQAVVGLIFGKDVGTRVISNLISSILAPLGSLLSGIVSAFISIFRR